MEVQLSSVASPALARRLCQATSALVVVDLRGLELLSCGGLHLLLSAARRARATGGRLVVVHGPGTVERLFEVVDVTLELELVDRPPSRLPPPRCWRREAT